MEASEDAAAGGSWQRGAAPSPQDRVPAGPGQRAGGRRRIIDTEGGFLGPFLQRLRLPPDGLSLCSDAALPVLHPANGVVRDEGRPMGPCPRWHQGPGQKHRERSHFAPSSQDATPKISALRVAAGRGQPRELCAWLSFPTGQMGAPALGVWCKRPYSPRGRGLPRCSVQQLVRRARCQHRRRTAGALCPTDGSLRRHPVPHHLPALLCWVPLPGPSRTAGGWRGGRGDPGLAETPVAERGNRGNEVSWCNFHCPL